MATVREVAAEAKVACSTVSHVFNGTASISEATRQRVLEAAHKLGYVPRSFINPRRSVSRKVIVLKRVGRDNPLETVGVEEDYADSIVNAAFLCLSAHNFGVWVLPHVDGERDDCIKSINITDYAGMLVIDNVVERINVFPCHPLPTVLAYCDTDLDQYSSVIPDDFHGAYTATQHLISLGHESIAFINGPEDWFVCLARYQGYLTALAEAKIPLNSQLVCNSGWSVDHGKKAIADILARAEFTAVFAANDLLAVGAMQTMMSRGLNVPQDIAVVGFDDRATARIVTPKLTTVHLPLAAIGERAALELVQMIQLNSVGQRQLVSKAKIQCPLIVRESCGQYLMSSTPMKHVSGAHY